MNFLKLVAVTAVAAVASTTADATTFRFDGSDGLGGAFDTPTNAGNIVGCNSQNKDLCTGDDAEGFTYSKNGVTFTAVAYRDNAEGQGTIVELIQDLINENQGLGAISVGLENRRTQDQINSVLGESILFTFTEATKITNIFLNSGLSRDCPGLTDPEGPCGTVGVKIDGGPMQTFSMWLVGGLLTADGVNALSLAGTTIEFFALSLDDVASGFSIEQFSIVPVPGALPLLLSGIAGLGFASRRRKSA